MRFEPLAVNHLPEAIDLLWEELAHECRHVPALAKIDASTALPRHVESIVGAGRGVAAVEDGRLRGYLAFYGPIPGLFGATGAISPLHGHAAGGPDRERLISVLFQHAAEPLVREGVRSIAISTFAHDVDVARSLVFTGFGIRNADAIRDLDPAPAVPAVDGFAFDEAAHGDLLAILPLENALVRHLRASPTFMAVGETSEDAFVHERSRDARYFVARHAGQIVGYVKVSGEGENILTATPGVGNISGAYLLPAHRGHGVFSALVDHVAAILAAEGTRLLGVDFETMNPAARRFWEKSFAIYTHSYVRRIDDGTPEPGS